MPDTPRPDLRTTLAGLAAAQRDQETQWRPSLHSAADPEALAVVEDLLARGQILAVHDQLDALIDELIETRAPKLRPEQPGYAEAVAAVLGPVPREQFGNWIYFPWLRRLVRLLPEAEFRELRTSRNRNKITATEQAKLASLDLAIVGLSVGRATAVTLALEGVGGHIRLADFDTLSGSNMNRLRAGVHEIGVNKAISTARTLAEIDPYLRVTVYPEGLGPADLDGFLTEGGRVDILFEECDDLEMKVRIRDAARRHRMPVLMETSDRGMLDIERFDLEPERPLFHGLAGDLDPDSLRGLSTYEKVPVVAKIIGLSTLSKRMAASMIDVDATLKSWPQLASAVALGGALNTDAARRIALGQLQVSGRFFVDLDEQVSAERIAHAVPSGAELGPAIVPEPLPTLELGAGPVRADELERLLAWAQRAPSGGNSQPWRFADQLGAGDATIECRVDRARAVSVLDDGLLAAQLACGAAAEHLIIAASGLGLAVELDAERNPEQPEHAWRATLRRAEIAVDPLLAQIERRCTNRQRGPRVPLTDEHAAQLEAEAEHAGAQLQIVRDAGQLATLAQVLARAERQRLLCARLHRDMFDEIRWTRAEVLATRDGLDARTLELNPTEQAGMTLLSSWEVMETLRDVGGGEGLDRPTREAVESASAVALLRVSGNGHLSYHTGGRALARVWLRASALGLAMQPMSAILFLLQHIAQTGGSALDTNTIRVFRATAEQLGGIFPEQPQATRVLMFRLACATPPSARSLRRRVADSLEPPR